MKKMVFTKTALVAGADALNYLGEVEFNKAVIVTGGSSMERTGVIGRIRNLMEQDGRTVSLYSGIGKNPTTTEVLAGADFLRQEGPDVILAVGGGSAIDAAKLMALLYEHPELNFENVFTTALENKKLKSIFIAIPSTSGTASEVTNVSVVTVEDRQLKLAVKTECIRPDIAILDGSLPLTLPDNIAAETGMDALTHALEAYVNKNGNDFTDALAKEAIEGLMEWLPVSCGEATAESREKVHHFQCMAGMAFSNSGLGIVHGVSHAFGGKYNLAHGLANAVILPYSMDYNKKDPQVATKYAKLSRVLGGDVIEGVKKLQAELGIPSCIADSGVAEQEFLRDFDQLLKNSMQGATAANPIRVSEADMRQFLSCVFYGTPVHF